MSGRNRNYCQRLAQWAWAIGENPSCPNWRGAYLFAVRVARETLKPIQRYRLTTPASTGDNLNCIKRETAHVCPSRASDDAKAHDSISGESTVGVSIDFSGGFIDASLLTARAYSAQTHKRYMLRGYKRRRRFRAACEVHSSHDGGRRQTRRAKVSFDGAPQPSVRHSGQPA